MVIDDDQLLRRARDGDVRALDGVCDRWLPVVLGWTGRLGGPTIDAEDAAHDVFLVVFRRLGGLADPAAFPSWLFSITRRVVAAHRRRAWLRRWWPGAVPDVASSDPDPAGTLESSRTAARVWVALEALPAHHREVLVLCDLEERPDSEVAVMLGIPKSTVKSRLRRARTSVREALASELDLKLPAFEGGAE